MIMLKDRHGGNAIIGCDTDAEVNRFVDWAFFLGFNVIYLNLFKVLITKDPTIG
jgi:hypothetical protein